MLSFIDEYLRNMSAVGKIISKQASTLLRISGCDENKLHAFFTDFHISLRQTQTQHCM